ncbi:sn-glycerol-3-phosphate ABC transporter substrate-binding protein UgpB [Rhizobacter fulvus]|jgi:sn-glycerol 3-phosphate transport system substrate-binding protein
MKFKSLAIACGAFALALSGPAQAQVEVQWWHSMTGGLNEWVNDLAKEFNASQKDYKVVPTFKGNYDEAMTAAMAAFRAGNAPHILQVFEVGTATMMASKGAIKPVGEVMKQSGVAFDPKAYVPAVAGYYTASNGEMLSFPFNSSTTIFYYNKDAFKAAGLDPNKAPSTWPEVVAAAAKLKANGSKCPYSTSWMSWVHLESFSLWHNTLFATQNNGFGGPSARLAFNSPLHLRHFENLANMAKQGLFVYKGRASVAVPSFVSGECAMFTGSSGSYADVAKGAKFAYGLAPLPYYPDVAGAPQNTAIGGASLWVMAGKKPAEYKGVAEFFKYLSNPEVQSASHKRTGYLPITMAAYQLTEKSGFYKDKPGTDVAVTQMIRKTTDKSRGIRLGNFVQIRTILDEETEAIWSGKKEPKQALEDAMKRGNEQLERFEKASKATAAQ